MAYSSTLDTVNQPHLYIVRDQAYFANDFDPIRAIRVQDGTDYAAGIVGPTLTIGMPIISSGGLCTPGQHFLRYRYQDTKTQYVSNPSQLTSYTVNSSSTALIFIISSSSNIRPSLDGRVNRILVEMTLLESGDFYVAETATNENGTVRISLNDRALVAKTSVAANWGGPDDSDSWSHNQPPLAAFGAEHKGRHFVGGRYDREYSVLVSSGSTTVTLTTSQSFSTGYFDRYLWFPSDDRVYDIQQIDNATQLTMTQSYDAAGGTKTAILTAFEPNMLYWSLPLYMESFDTTRNLRRVLEGRGDVLRAMASYQGDLLLFGKASAESLVYTTNPAPPDGYLIQIPGRRGAHNQRCVVEAMGSLYVWDRRGVWTLSGKSIQHLSDPVRDIIDLEIDYAYDDLFHAAFCPVTNSLLCFFVRQGESTSRYAMVFDVLRGKWSVSSWQQAITATTVCIKPNGAVILMLLDANGYAWEYGSETYRDGVLGTNAYATINSGSTTSVFELNETFGVNDLQGVYAYLPDLDETVRVISNTVNAITVSSSVASAPTPGSPVYLGVIPSLYEFKWEMSGGGGSVKTHPIYFMVDQIPADSGYARVYFYADGSDTASLWSLNVNDTAPDGVIMVDGLDYVEFSLTIPHVSIPVPLDFQRSIKAKIVVFRPDGEMRLLSARFAAEEVPSAGE